MSQNPRFIVSNPGKETSLNQRWTLPQLGLLLKCKTLEYENFQCAQVLEHYYRGRTEGKDYRVALHAQKLKDVNGKFAHRINDRLTTKDKETINSNWANWTTLKIHEGVLLELLLLAQLTQRDLDLQGLLQTLIPNQDILPTPEPRPELTRDILEARIREALSRFEEYKPPLKDQKGLWKKEAIKDWIKAWKVEKEVAQIFDNMSTNV